jgi:hypothetical protein
MFTLLEATANTDSFLVANPNRVPPALNERGLLSAQDAADYLSISLRKFQQIVADKNCVIKPRRLGVSVRFRLVDLDSFIDELPIGSGKYNGAGNGNDL